MAIRLDFDSVSSICEGSKQAMVYGFQHCRYTQVAEALKTKESPIKMVFDCSIGNPFAPSGALTTLEGSRIEQIAIPNLEQVDVVRELKQYCKAGLVNMIMENIKRAKAGLPLIPVLFVVDILDNKYRLHPAAVASKKNTFVTMGEMRRVYKLCNDPSLHPLIRNIARRSFKFVKVVYREESDQQKEYALVPIDPFWAHQDWESEWAARKEQSNLDPPADRLFWRNKLNQMVPRSAVTDPAANS